MSSFKARNLFAVLRGITPSEVLQVAELIAQAGITLIEVTLNSPQALESIKLLSKAKDEGLLRAGHEHGHGAPEIYIGAGTVIKESDVDEAFAAGASFMVSAHFDAKVIQRTKRLGLTSIAGVFTASECFGALENGADILKLFPASILGTSGFQAIKATLPKSAEIFAVGGVSAEDFSAWKNAGIDGFGIGTSLFKPGRAAEEVSKRAKEIVASYDAIFTAL